MSFFVQPTAAPQPKNRYVWFAAVGVAAVFVMLAVAQLYSYEDYPDVIASLGMYGGRQAASIYAALLVIGEIAAIPFLLAMRLSPAMRFASMVASWLVVAAWTLLSLVMNATVNALTNSGLLGATIPVAPGWWITAVFALLAALVAWISWGMWPLRHSPRSSTATTTE